MNYVVVRKYDFEIVYKYEASAPIEFCGVWGDSTLHWNVAVPEGLDADCVVAQANGEDVSIVEDANLVAAKLSATRAAKLASLRALRAPKLSDVDILVNDYTLGDTTLTQAQIKDYRTALKAVTDPYKNYANDSGHAAALDALNVATYTWPTEPT